MENKELIETLPFSLKEFSLMQYRFKEQDYLRNSRTSLQAARIKLFFKLLSCGLHLGAGFVAVIGKEEFPYQVSKVDYALFEIGAVRYDLVIKDRHIDLRREIENSRIDGIIGHLKTEMINA